MWFDFGIGIILGMATTAALLWLRHAQMPARTITINGEEEAWLEEIEDAAA